MIKGGIIEPSSIFILNIHQFDATHLIDLPYFLFSFSSVRVLANLFYN